MVIQSLFNVAIVATAPIWPPVHEVARDADGVVVALSNTGVPYGRLYYAFLVPNEAEDDPYTVRGLTLGGASTHPDIDFGRIGGPLSWGITDGGWYTVSHRRPGTADYFNGAAEESPHFIESWVEQTHIVATVQPLAEEIESQRYNRARSWPDDRHTEIGRIRRDFAEAHGCYCAPLVDYIVENTWPLFRNWDLGFDIVYTSLDEVTAAAVRGGRLMIWQLHQTGNLEAP